MCDCISEFKGTKTKVFLFALITIFSFFHPFLGLPSKTKVFLFSPNNHLSFFQSILGFTVLSQERPKITLCHGKSRTVAVIVIVYIYFKHSKVSEIIALHVE